MLFELPVFYGQTVKLVDMKVGVKIRFTLPCFAKYKRQKLAYERKKKNLFIDTTRLPWMEALDIRRRQIRVVCCRQVSWRSTAHFVTYSVTLEINRGSLFI